MRLTVFGGCGAWPAAGQACSGYLLEQDGFRLLIDPGYAVLPRLLTAVDAAAVDAVVVSHGHPDHCADLSPLLRARALSAEPPAPLPVYAPAGAVDAVLALDPIRSVAGAAEPVVLTDGDGVRVGPFDVLPASLPHFVPNLGVRISDGAGTLVYSGDAGPDPAMVELARDADLLLIEATYPDAVPDEDAGLLCSAVEAAEQGAAAGARRIMLTHLWPGIDPAEFLAAAARTGVDRASVCVAAPGPAQPIGV